MLELIPFAASRAESSRLLRHGLVAGGHTCQAGFQEMHVSDFGAAGAALLSLFAVTEATVAADGTLTEPFWALALGMLALTAAGLVGLGLLFLRVRRRIR